MAESARFLPLSPPSPRPRLGCGLRATTVGQLGLAHGAWLTWALLGLGCSAAPSPIGGTGGTVAVPSAESISFMPSETLLLGPGDLGEVSVKVEPPGFHSVSFTLAANPSDTGFDGFLESANVVSDDDGFAVNFVHAPTSSAVFSVRASVGDLVALRTVSVSTQGFATVIASPVYAGVREVGSWDAVARLGVACSDLESYWEDGDIEAEGDDDGATLSGVPVGPALALVVRAGRYIGGCVSVSALSAGEMREVEVPVTDRPLQLAGSSFELSLDVEERTESFVQLLQQAAARGVSDYALGEVEDASVLLTDYAQAIADETHREYFLAHTEAYDYLDVTLAHLSSPTALRNVVLSRLIDAAASIDGQGVWALAAELEGEDSLLTVNSAAGVSGPLSGFAESAVLSVVREPDDRLILSADLEFLATRWLGAIADQGNDLDTLPLDGLELAVDCAGLAAALFAAGGVEIYPGCDDECAVSLCESALELGWDRARMTAEDSTTLRIGISGDATIDDEARPIALHGDWVGSIDSNELSVAGPAGSPNADDL